jgi:hypothetical protein
MLDGIYVLQTVGIDGPEYRVCEFEDSSILTMDEFGKKTKNMDVLKKNLRTFFGTSKVFTEADDAINYATSMLETFQKSGVEFHNKIRIIPPIDFKF